VSNHLAIATVTATLCELLKAGVNVAVPGVTISVSSDQPNGTSQDGTEAGISVYLYQVIPNSAFRNVDLPTRDSNGRVVQRPQAALDLFYLLSFYGNNGRQVPQRLLGHAVRVLHDQPILTRDDIKAAIDANDYLGGSDLAEQVEKVKFSPVPLDLEELSKLWSVFFQTPYFLSVVYQASVVLIESPLPVRSPLPVLERTVHVQPNLIVPIPPFPTLETVVPPNQQPRAKLDDELTITGYHLEGDSVTLVFENARFDVHHELSPSLSTATSIKVTLPDVPEVPEAPADWPIGVYTVQTRIERLGERTRTTNKLSFLLAPKILDMQVTTSNSKRILTVYCSPEIRRLVELVPPPEPPKLIPLQHVSVILRDREFPLKSLVEPDRLEFDVTDMDTGSYYVRLRVDGIDSLLIDYTTTPPEFHETWVEIPE
jgi:hypothetical protein